MGVTCQATFRNHIPWPFLAPLSAPVLWGRPPTCQGSGCSLHQGTVTVLLLFQLA